MADSWLHPGLGRTQSLWKRELRDFSTSTSGPGVWRALDVIFPECTSSPLIRPKSSWCRTFSIKGQAFYVKARFVNLERPVRLQQISCDVLLFILHRLMFHATHVCVHSHVHIHTHARAHTYMCTHAYCRLQVSAGPVPWVTCLVPQNTVWLGSPNQDWV